LSRIGKAATPALKSDKALKGKDSGTRKDLLGKDVKWAGIETEQLFESMVGSSSEMHEIYTLMERVADTDATVLIEGESGTGKELVARAIHDNGSRREGEFVPIACGALPETLLESELFGHAKGAFSGASSQKKGLFEIADRGTLFLDDVVNLTPGIQPKLLRALEEGTIRRVGATLPTRVDVRVIASTNKPLEKEVKEGRFREDLFYRLNVVTLELPPLRKRTGDIPQLARYFLDLYSRRMKRKVKGFASETMDLLLSYKWPGNVRELENIIQSSVIVATDAYIKPQDMRRITANEEKTDVKWLSWRQARDAGEDAKRSVEAACICSVLSRNDGNVTYAAKDLKIDRRVLRRLIRKHNIEKSQFFR
jgi:transcriptional regulator with PAS, ATPase and Fis domain